MFIYISFITCLHPRVYFSKCWTLFFLVINILEFFETKFGSFLSSLTHFDLDQTLFESLEGQTEFSINISKLLSFLTPLKSYKSSLVVERGGCYESCLFRLKMATLGRSDSNTY